DRPRAPLRPPRRRRAEPPRGRPRAPPVSGGRPQDRGGRALADAGGARRGLGLVGKRFRSRINRQDAKTPRRAPRPRWPLPPSLPVSTNYRERGRLANHALAPSLAPWRLGGRFLLLELSAPLRAPPLRA